MKYMSPKFQLGCILSGIFLGVLAFHLVGHRVSKFDPDKVGLGLNTTSAVSYNRNLVISSGNPRMLIPAIQSARESRDHVVLWLGASQLHAINHYEQGDDLAVGYANLQSTNNKNGDTYVQCSLGNANFHEMLCSYLMLRGLDVKVDTLLVALTYDDLREAGIRPEVRKWMESPKIWLTKTQPGELRSLQEELNKLETNQGVPNSPVARNPTSGTPQEQLEAEIVSGLVSFWAAYGKRGQIRSMIHIFLRSFAARILGGVFQRRTPEVPKVIKSWNQGALETLITVAIKDGLRICLYKQPHRPGLQPFLHNRQDYDRWHESIEAMARKTPQIHYQDFETIVPASLWGLTNEGRPDCFHFQDKGHRILGTAINTWLQSLPKH